MKRHVSRKKLCDLSKDLIENFNEKIWINESLEKIIIPLDVPLLDKNKDSIENDNKNQNQYEQKKQKIENIDLLFENLDNHDSSNILILNSNNQLIKMETKNQLTDNLEEQLKNKYSKEKENGKKEEDIIVSEKNNKNKCNYCTKIFSRKDSLNRHLEGCLVKIFKESQLKKKLEEEKLKRIKDYQANNNSLPPSKNVEVIEYNKNKIYDWELYKHSLIPHQPIQYTDFSYYKGLCLIQMPFEDEFRDNHLTQDTKIRLFTSIHYPSLLFELMKNHHNINVVPESKETSIVYKKNGFARVNNDILTLETTLKLKKYFLKNYMEMKNFHPLMDNELFTIISDTLYKSILKKSDEDYKMDYLRIYDKNREHFNIEEIIKKNNFLIEDVGIKDFILKKQFIFF